MMVVMFVLRKQILGPIWISQHEPVEWTRLESSSGMGSSNLVDVVRVQTKQSVLYCYHNVHTDIWRLKVADANCEICLNEATDMAKLVPVTA